MVYFTICFVFENKKGPVGPFYSLNTLKLKLKPSKIYKKF